MKSAAKSDMYNNRDEDFNYIGTWCFYQTSGHIAAIRKGVYDINLIIL